MKFRNSMLAAVAGALAVGIIAFAAPAQVPAKVPAEVGVWKAPSCGCCGGWIKHMEAAGFTVKVHEIEDLEPVKAANGVPEALGSCHTATVGGYVVEGHVPAQDIIRLLTQKPKAKGLAAP